MSDERRTSSAGAPRTIMIMAGGTGGHIFPALAVAEHLRAQGWRVVWVGVRGGMEEWLIPPDDEEPLLVRSRERFVETTAEEAPCDAFKALS